MKTSRFVRDGLFVERCIRREGPSPVFIVCYRGKAWVEFEPKAIRKACHMSKGLPSREAFDKWIAEFETTEKAPELDMQRIASEGFGPEAHLDHTDPNYQTKTVL